jgi:hypothetical protein
VITGAEVFEGGRALTVDVGAEVAEVDPPALLAVTTDRTVWPASPLVSV